MKNIFYNLRSNFVKKRWVTTGKLKVLIETNKYFSENEWNKVLSEKIDTSRIEILFFNNKYEGYKLVKNAQAVFSFGDNRNYIVDNQQFQYYGTSQPDLSNKKLPNVYYAKGISSNSVAEYCVAYSLILLNSFNIYFSNQFKKEWEQNIISAKKSRLSSKVIGVIGIGNNGKKIAELFRKIGCKVYGYDINAISEKDVDRISGSLNELLMLSDIVISAVNLTKDTHKFINYETLLKMKESAYLINVSRGSVINEVDLYRVLKMNKIAGAVLDVTVDEPLSRYSKLWKLNNLIITPHISGNINRYHIEVMNDFADKLINFMSSNV